MPPISPDMAFLFEELPDGVVVLDGEGLVDGVNQAFLELTGRAREEVLGHPIEAIIADEDLVRLLGFSTIFGADVTRDNSIIFTSTDGSHRTLLVNSAKSERLLQTLLTARATGAVQQELADTTRWAASEQERADDIAQARDALATTNDALRAAQVELEGAYARLQSEAATRLKLEGELRLAQKLESVGQLASGIAHEINTPAQYVGDSIQFLAESFESISGVVAKYRQAFSQLLATPEYESIAQELKEIEEQADLAFIQENASGAFERAADGVVRIASIVSAMKDFAHPDSPVKCPADLNRAIQTTLTITHNEYKYVADVETFFGDIPLVSCHVGSINQVILNLLVNAAHAIGEVVGKNGEKGQIRISTVRECDTVRIDIEDTGAGIPESVRDRIFEPFFTTKEVGKGSGQGLAIARSIVVDKHSGSLTFITEAGKGTTFTVRLPLTG